MKPALLFAIILSTAACVPSTDVKESSPGNINRDAPYEWNLTGSLDLKISESFSEAERLNITSMSNAWTVAVESKQTFFTHSEFTTEKSSAELNLDTLGEDNILGIYKITHWPSSLPSSALAVTQLFGRRYNIGTPEEYVGLEHADILINENIYNFRTGDEHVSGTFDFRTVVLHELGHFLGLQHKEGDSVMIPAIGEYTKKVTPTYIDSRDIAAKYNISLSSSGTQQLIAKKAQTFFRPKNGDPGKQVKIIMELRADGECIHKENGAIIGRHR